MKKTHLFAATALLSVLLVGSFAEAKATAKTTPAETTSTTEAVTDQASMMRKNHPGMPKLSEASQKLMQETMDKLHEDSKATFEAVQTKHKEMQEIMKAPTFDKSAYLAKHEEIQSLMAKLSSDRAEAFASVAEKMTPEERARFADRGMMAMRRDGKGPHGGKRGAGRGLGMNPDRSMMMDDDASANAKSATTK
ncbi:MAG: Spy/CpxP family protein refolding chaperone [Alphaproteobacteria bacterium]|nr:Spy/CpxP family protein refolding chaperone [Alphaproteobacteria bacterium]